MQLKTKRILKGGSWGYIMGDDGWLFGGWAKMV